MIDAPERIWAWRNEPNGEMVVSGPDEPRLTYSTPYIRADRIEALEAENARMRRALKDVVEAYQWWSVDQYDRDQSVVYDAIDDARAALATIRRDDDE